MGERVKVNASANRRHKKADKILILFNNIYINSMIKNIMIIVKRYNCPGGGSVGSSSWTTTVAAPDTELK